MIVANVKRVLDPTGTTTLRRGFAAKVSGKYNRLSSLVRRSIVREDCFGLAVNPLRLHAATPVRAFAFTSNREKVKGFMGWLKAEQDTLRLPLATSEPGTTAWANTYVQSGYRKGVVDGFFAAKREGLVKAEPFNEMNGPQFNEWVTKSFASPVSAQRLSVLYARNFDGLANITTEMDTQITQVLSQGLIDGESPLALARKIQKTVTGIGRNRARTLARTEIINAHAEGTLDSMQHMGIENVQVWVEWSTAGDDRVCELCNQFSNEKFTIEQARGKIPYHPNCRCAWLPVPPRPKDALKQMLKPRAPLAPLPTEVAPGPPVPKAIVPKKAPGPKLPRPAKEPVTRRALDIENTRATSQEEAWMPSGEVLKRDEALAEWMKGMSTAERQALHDLQAVFWEGLDEKDVLRGALARAPSSKGTLYRGMFGGKAQARYKVGDVMSVTKPTSASRNQMVAEEFSLGKNLRGKTPTLIEIRTTSAIDIRGTGFLDRSEEYLLREGSNYRVTSVTRETLLKGYGGVPASRTGTYVRVVMEEITPGSPAPLVPVPKRVVKRVPKVKPKGSVLEQNVADSVERLRSMRGTVETVEVFDSNTGQRLFREEGFSYGVRITGGNARKIRGNVLIHNHPTGGSLAPTDIITAQKFGAVEIRAVGRLPGEHFVQRPGKPFNIGEFKRMQKKIAKQEHDKVARQILHDPDLPLRGIETEYTHRVNEGLAKVFGYYYGRLS